jgi:dTDP-4-amino-4,6-dideoxygalactose transaminase
MIPRFKPALGFDELKAAFSLPKKDDVKKFEEAFAELMEQKYALAFPYGRTGLTLLLEALGLKDKEIICPAYTCVVVPHAIVYSSNIPVFVDCESDGFNMDLDQAEKKITPRTGAIVATSLFGYPVNLDKLDKIRSNHPHVNIIQDCAHSFAAEWEGRPVQKGGVAALFGLNISKTLTSIFGGMITTDNDDIYRKLKTMRDQKLKRPGWRKDFRRLLYLLAVYPAFWESVYGLINRLERSGLLDNFVRYYDETKIDMPFDFLYQMASIEARVGIENVKRYDIILQNRWEAADYYFEYLENKPDFILPPKVKGATYSHFAVRVNDRDVWLQKGIRMGVQLGWLIEYSVPEMKAYGGNRLINFPVAGKYARSLINLPVWGGAHVARKVTRIVSS